MSKVISFRRRELIWDEYGTDWTEKDFEELKEWLNQRKENPRWSDYYEHIKDISFDELCDMMDRKIPDVEWTIQCGDGEYAWTYTESVVSYITEVMRDDACGRDVIDSWFADDSEEDINIYEQINRTFSKKV